MKRKKLNLLKILTVGLVCALASIFLFSGCSAKRCLPEEANPYGVYTNLTLSLDCGEGKVRASVKNTFTFLPSTVKVTVELYKSEAYKSSYKEMALAGENTASDLDMGKSVTAEAETYGKQMYWQARAYYKIDEKDWQEQTTKIWLIKGNGNIVTTNALPPKEEEGVTPPSENDPEIKLPAESFRLSDVIDSEPLSLNYTRFRTNEPMPDIVVDEDGTVHMPLVGIAAWGGTDEEEAVNKLYDLFTDVTFKKVENDNGLINDNGYKYFFDFKLGNGYELFMIVGRLGKVRCELVIDDNSEIIFISETGVIDIEMLNGYVDKYVK